MKRRYRLLLNLCALVLLAFSLYLNFVKKDGPEIPAPFGPVQSTPVAASDNQTQKAITGKSHQQAAISVK